MAGRLLLFHSLAVYKRSHMATSMDKKDDPSVVSCGAQRWREVGVGEEGTAVPEVIDVERCSVERGGLGM